MKIYEKHKKSPKMSKKHIKSKEKRPKAIDSSHNACRFGYPFFLSPSDDDAMLEIPNPTPSVHQTSCTFVRWFFGFVLTKKKRNTTRQNSPEKIKLKDKRKTNTARLSQIPKIPRISK